MTEAEFRNSLRKGYELFQELGVTRSFTMPMSLGSSKEFNEVALDKDCPYPEVYFKGLKLSQYNFQLRDYSYFQFSYTSENDLRFAFYPSPFGRADLERIARLTAALDAGVIDFETYCVMIEGFDVNYRRPLIRYDYNTEQHKANKHPTSHLHLGTFGEDRWPLERRLTPFAFALLMAKLFFSEDWEALTEECQIRGRFNEYDDKLAVEKTLCCVTPIEKFHAVERSLFFIA